MIAIISRIEYAANQPPSFLARWTSRLALFSILLLVAAVFLHRIFTLSTPVAMNLAGMAFAGAALALVLALVAGLDIWITGRQGTARIVVGFCAALGVLALPAAVWIQSQNWPAISDISTDMSDPPGFLKVAAARPEGSNSADYDRGGAAQEQARSYPDLKTLAIPRSVDDGYEAVRQALVKLKYTPIVELPPSASPDGMGLIEFTDTTMFLGFKDDVTIRVKGDGAMSYVDIRSASHYGRNDFGQNANRVRMILREIVGRLEASTPAQNKPESEPDKSKSDKSKNVVKRPRGVRRPSKAAQKQSAPSRSDIRRGPGRSDLLP